MKLLKKRHEKAVRKNFFTYRVVNPWNKLPDEVVLAPTINTLKNRLDKHWILICHLPHALSYCCDKMNRLRKVIISNRSMTYED